MSSLPLFLFCVVVFAVLFLFPPVAGFAFQPGTAFKLCNVGHIARHYAKFFPVFIVTVFAFVIYWVLPLRMNDDAHHQMYEDLVHLVKDRRI